MSCLCYFYILVHTRTLCPCKPDLRKPSQTLRWLGVNLSVLRQQTWGATEYWMGGPSLSLTDTPSGSLWDTSLEFHPSGRAAITASNRAATRLPHLASPVIKTPHQAEAHIRLLSLQAFMTSNHMQIFTEPVRHLTAEFLKCWWNL